jgi:hypothetical protein
MTATTLTRRRIRIPRRSGRVPRSQTLGLIALHVIEVTRVLDRALLD